MNVYKIRGTHRERGRFDSDSLGDFITDVLFRTLRPSDVLEVNAKVVFVTALLFQQALSPSEDILGPVFSLNGMTEVTVFCTGPGTCWLKEWGPCGVPSKIVVRDFQEGEAARLRWYRNGEDV